MPGGGGRGGRTGAAAAAPVSGRKLRESGRFVTLLLGSLARLLLRTIPLLYFSSQQVGPCGSPVRTGSVQLFRWFGREACWPYRKLHAPGPE